MMMRVLVCAFVNCARERQGRTGTACRETTVICTPFSKAQEYTAAAAAKSNMLFTELSGL